MNTTSVNNLAHMLGTGLKAGAGAGKAAPSGLADLLADLQDNGELSEFGDFLKQLVAKMKNGDTADLGDPSGDNTGDLDKLLQMITAGSGDAPTDNKDTLSLEQALMALTGGQIQFDAAGQPLMLQPTAADLAAVSGAATGTATDTTAAVAAVGDQTAGLATVAAVQTATAALATAAGQTTKASATAAAVNQTTQASDAPSGASDQLPVQTPTVATPAVAVAANASTTVLTSPAPTVSATQDAPDATALPQSPLPSQSAQVTAATPAAQLAAVQAVATGQTAKAVDTQPKADQGKDDTDVPQVTTPAASTQQAVASATGGKAKTTSSITTNTAAKPTANKVDPLNATAVATSATEGSATAQGLHNLAKDLGAQSSAPAIEHVSNPAASAGASHSDRVAGALAADVVGQIADAASVNASRLGNQIVIRLNPPQLGDVRMTISSDGQTVTGKIVVSDPDTLTALRGETAALAQRLADNGIQVKRFEISMNEAPQQDFAHTGRDGQQRFDSQQAQTQAQAQGQGQGSDNGPRGGRYSSFAQAVAGVDDELSPAGSTAQVSDTGVNVWM